jgi:hypothetical protein
MKLPDETLIGFLFSQILDTVQGFMKREVPLKINYLRMVAKVEESQSPAIPVEGIFLFLM